MEVGEGTVTFDDFGRLDIRIGTITNAEPVEGTDKLLKLTVDTGESELRQLVAGLADAYAADEVVGCQVPVLTNLAPKTIRGVESQGMVLCPADNAGTPVLLHPDRELKPGAEIQ